jgi:hypothetical protein
MTIGYNQSAETAYSTSPGPEYIDPEQQSGDTQPITGGDTSVTLTAASILQSLGVNVAPLGSATIEATDSDPVARFAITGGTEGPIDDTSVILHQGSGLELSSQAGVINLRDFRIDTENLTVKSNVTVNGTAAGNVTVFDIGAGGSLTLTDTAAGVVSGALGVPAITSDVTIGTAAPMPVVDWACLQDHCQPDNGMQFLASPDTQPIIGGETAVALTAASTLQSLHVSVSPLGSAVINPADPDPIAQFPITGGTLGPADGEAVILHQGSGLELEDRDSSVELRDFLIDTQNHVVDANVTVDDLSFGNITIFEIGGNGTLLLTPAAAGVLSDAFGTPAITAGLGIGTAVPSPIALPMGVDA